MSVKFLGGKVTVSVEPFFWLMSGLLGLSIGRGSMQEVVLWAAVVAVSVLVHEAGHAAVCLLFGSGADVVLHGFGGATRRRDSSPLGTWRTAALDLAGCAAGGALAATSFMILIAASAWQLPFPPLALALAAALLQVNIWFTLFNLMPASPLDGGKFVSGLLSARFGVGGRRVGHALGLAFSGAAALWFLSRGATFAALICGALTVGEARSLRRALSMTTADADESVNLELARAAALWSGGRRADAVAALAVLREKTGAGLIYADATLQLAFYFYLLDRAEESYALFKVVSESDMPPAARCAYADVARRRGDHALALRLGRTNFHNEPGPETAEAAALAAAGLGDARETVSWLKTALRLGLAKSSLRAREFDAVRGTEEFRELLSDI